MTTGTHWRTLADRLQKAASEAGLGPPNEQPTDVGRPLALFDRLVTHGELRSVTRPLFSTGHYADAVKKGFICLDNAVRDKSGETQRTGDSLMRHAFSPNKPLLKLNKLSTESEKNEQQGYMDLYAGSMKGIRNPRSHEASMKDDVETALELLSLANHLMRRLDAAVVASSCTS